MHRSHTWRCFSFLEKMNADRNLILHSQIVLDVARFIINILKRYCDRIDIIKVECGAILHDIGKIVHQEELFDEGIHHAEAGKNMLLQTDFQDIANFCVTHLFWKESSLEERIVALADRLWKGQRDGELEASIIREVVPQDDFWKFFCEIDAAFEKIADDGHVRLQRTIEMTSHRCVQSP